MPDLAQLHELPVETRPFVARVVPGFDVTGTYWFEGLTKNDVRRYQDTAATNQLDAVIGLLAHLRITSDLTAGGQPVEWTVEGLADVPRNILLAVHNAIMEDVLPKATNNTDSTSTTAQAEA